MHDLPITRTSEWVERTVGLFTTKDELAQKAQASDLPDEARAAIDELPGGELRREKAVELLNESLTAGAYNTKGDHMGRP